jgi:hypothetical protein
VKTRWRQQVAGEECRATGPPCNGGAIMRNKNKMLRMKYRTALVEE